MAFYPEGQGAFRGIPSVGNLLRIGQFPDQNIPFLIYLFFIDGIKVHGFPEGDALLLADGADPGNNLFGKFKSLEQGRVKGFFFGPAGNDQCGFRGPF